MIFIHTLHSNDYILNYFIIGFITFKMSKIIGCCYWLLHKFKSMSKKKKETKQQPTANHQSLFPAHLKAIKVSASIYEWQPHRFRKPKHELSSLWPFEWYRQASAVDLDRVFPVWIFRVRHAGTVHVQKLRSKTQCGTGTLRPAEWASVAI